LAFYALICVAFPIVGAIMGMLCSGMASMTGPVTDGGRPLGPQGPEPVPDQPDGGRHGWSAAADRGNATAGRRWPG
jgi:hypothetical protein